jgi:hypothetical protein
MALISVATLIGFDPDHFKEEDELSRILFFRSLPTLCSNVGSMACNSQLSISGIEDKVSELIEKYRLISVVEIGAAYFGSKTAAVAFVEGLSGKSGSFWSWVLCSTELEEQTSSSFEPSPISEYASLLSQRRDLFRSVRVYTSVSIEVLPSLGILHSIFAAKPRLKGSPGVSPNPKTTAEERSALEETLGVSDCITNNSCVKFFSLINKICRFDFNSQFVNSVENGRFKTQKPFVLIIDDCLKGYIARMAEQLKTNEDEKAFRSQVEAVYRPEILKLNSAVYKTLEKHTEFVIIKKLQNNSFLIQYTATRDLAVLQFAKVLNEDLSFTPMKRKLNFF